MKKSFSFIGAMLISVAMSFCVSANDKILNTEVIKTSNIKVDNDLLYLYNNNVYKNDTFKFNITLNDNWKKPTYEDAHTFAFETNKPKMQFISDTSFDPNNSIVLAVGLEKLEPETKTLKLDTLTEMFKAEIPKVNKNTSNFSDTGSSAISGVPFKYFSFDINIDNKMFKSYMYIGVKDGNVYIFSIINVNNSNKSIVSKALKSIVIQ